RCQLLTCSTRLLTRYVSTTTSRTCASCHSSRRTGWSAVLVTFIPLLFPGVAVNVVAERFPESGLILVHEAECANPFGTLPEIEMRDEQPSWTAMCRRNRQTRIAGHDSPLAPNKVRHGDVRCVISVAMSHDIRSRRVRQANRLQKIVKRHALPCRIQLRPFRDAVNVRLDRGLRQRFELCPAPFPKRRCAKLNSEIPVLEFFSRRRSSRKNREIGRYILSRRYAVFRGLLLTT